MTAKEALRRLARYKLTGCWAGKVPLRPSDGSRFGFVQIAGLPQTVELRWKRMSQVFIHVQLGIGCPMGLQTSEPDPQRFKFNFKEHPLGNNVLLPSTQQSLRDRLFDRATTHEGWNMLMMTFMMINWGLIYPKGHCLEALLLGQWTATQTNEFSLCNNRL